MQVVCCEHTVRRFVLRCLCWALSCATDATVVG
jgi:hypothetical protein